jgi:hypothetical protein
MVVAGLAQTKPCNERRVGAVRHRGSSSEAAGEQLRNELGEPPVAGLDGMAQKRRGIA